MPTPPQLRILLASERKREAVRVGAALAPLQATLRRVDSAEGFAGTLSGFGPDVIVAGPGVASQRLREFLDLARVHAPAVPFLVVTSLADAREVVPLLDSGVTDYILNEDLDRLAPAVRRAARDAAERHQHRQALAAGVWERAQLQAVFETMQDGVMVFDMKGRTVLLNKAQAHTNGYASVADLARDVAYCASLYELTLPDGASVPVEDWPVSRVLRGEVVRDCELLGRRKDTGRRWYFSFTGTPVRDEQGSQISAVLVTHDITRQKEGEVALRESAERFRALADNIAQLAWMAEANGDITWYNRRWYDYTGSTFEEMRGWGWQMVHHPDHVERVTQRFRGAIATGERWEDTFPLRGRDGHYRWFLSRAFPVRDAHDRIVTWFGTNTDITEQLEAERQIRQLNQDLERRVGERTRELELTVRELDAFSHTVSHDLRAPLRAISGFVTLLDEHHRSQLDESGRKLLDRIAGSAARMGQLIEDLLQLSQYARQRPSKSEVDLEAVVRAVVDEVRGQFADRARVIVRPMPTVRADPSLLRQVLVNLIDNALKFTRGVPDPEVEVTAHRVEGGEVVVSVRDNGAGFEPAYTDRLFNVFQRLHSQQEFEGTGIGLSIVRRIVERHGGRVWASSEGPGTGAGFHFTLPE